ncbi:GNAT family N-acetyltransferase [Candidatus Hydrogenedentota bacterium]
MTEDSIQIREATSGDISQVSSLIRMGFRGVAEKFGLTPENCAKHPSNCTDNWIEDDLKRGVTYYILEHNSVPSGCVALERADNGVCYLERLAVLPEKRRAGFGKALVHHVIAEARRLGAERISIGIIANHTELKTWYKNMGFAETETREFERLPFLVTYLNYTL